MGGKYALGWESPGLRELGVTPRPDHFPRLMSLWLACLQTALQHLAYQDASCARSMDIVIGGIWNGRISQQRLLGNADFPAASMTAYEPWSGLSSI
jgi:hypothetical protein